MLVARDRLHLYSPLEPLGRQFGSANPKAIAHSGDQNPVSVFLQAVVPPPDKGRHTAAALGGAGRAAEVVR
jgi:hypothetical protein